MMGIIDAYHNLGWYIESQSFGGKFVLSQYSTTVLLEDVINCFV